jgi:hypothetical protein
MGRDMHALLESGAGADVTFKVEDEMTRAHRIILQVRRCAGSMHSGPHWTPFSPLQHSKAVQLSPLQANELSKHQCSVQMFVLNL